MFRGTHDSGSDTTLGLNVRPKVLYFSGSVANFALGLKYNNVAIVARTSDPPRPRLVVQGALVNT